MAENLPINIIPPAPIASASYDYVDLAEGAGYVTYYCFKKALSGSTSYGLTRDSNLYSVERETSGSSTLDIDYDLSPFNLSRTIKGTAIFNGSLYIDGNTAAGTQTGYFHVYLRKWDGTTETEIADSISPGVSVAGQEEGYAVVNMPLSVTSPTTFKNCNTSSSDFSIFYLGKKII